MISCKGIQFFLMMTCLFRDEEGEAQEGKKLMIHGIVF
jgi:hypothetical protein